MPAGQGVAAVRGATTVADDHADAIAAAAEELLRAAAEANGFGPDDVVSVIFTTTPDLAAGFPAAGARRLGWDVPVLGALEMAVPGAPERCIRVLIHVRTNTDPRSLIPVYLHGAEGLRPGTAPQG